MWTALLHLERDSESDEKNWTSHYLQDTAGRSDFLSSSSLCRITNHSTVVVMSLCRLTTDPGERNSLSFSWWTMLV